MISIRAVIGSIMTAALTGVVGFGSAYYLQQEESRARLAEQAQQHELELTRMAQAASAQQERDRDLLSVGLYQTWMSEPLVSQSRLARELLDRRPDFNFATVRTSPDVTEAEREAVRAVLRFWLQIDDLAADDSINMDRVTQRLGPDAMGWTPYMQQLTRDLDRSAALNAHAIYAESGVKRVADLERTRSERMPRAPRPSRQPRESAPD
jgi:hypothetical protein